MVPPRFFFACFLPACLPPFPPTDLLFPRTAATLPPREGITDTCKVDGMEGIANGSKCCPLVSARFACRGLSRTWCGVG